MFKCCRLDWFCVLGVCSLYLSGSAIPVANIATGGAAEGGGGGGTVQLQVRMTSNCLLLWRFLHNFNRHIGR